MCIGIVLVSRNQKEGGFDDYPRRLTDLRSSPTDLARIVEAVVRDRLPYVKIPVQTVRSWERRAPDDWAKVASWLAAQNVAVVQV